MTIKEPENNTDCIKMHKSDYVKDQQYDENEGSVKPCLALEASENKPSIHQQWLLCIGFIFVEPLTAAEHKTHWRRDAFLPSHITIALFGVLLFYYYF